MDPVPSPSPVASSRPLGNLSPLASPWDRGAQTPPASIYQQIPVRAPAHHDGAESCCSHDQWGPRGASRPNIKRRDPPKFSGSELDFPEFVTRWSTVMHQPGMPEGEELDWLRQSLPEGAKNSIYHCRTLQEAWAKLQLAYGNRNIIAEKLKRRLKSLELVAKTDYDRVIELYNEVESTVYKLKDLGHKDSLKSDAEFRAVMFRLLPRDQQSDWTKYDLSLFASEWEAFSYFLKTTYIQATRAREAFAPLEEGDEASNGARSKTGQEERCFNCDELGHRSRQCWKARKPKTEVRANAAEMSGSSAG